MMNMKMTQARVIQLSPDRPNIRLSIVKVSRDLDITFHWLIDELREKKQKLPRVVVFCRSITVCTNLYKLFLTELQEHSYVTPYSSHDIQSQLFAMFHSRVDDDDKTKIMDSVKSLEGACRVLFCTIAFGMGMDVPDVRTVIHFGPSSDVDDYLQEAGRAGRDGVPSHAILYCYPGCTVGHISPAMKKYVRNDDTCRRSLLLCSFGGHHDIGQLHHHSCCDVCMHRCICANPCSDQPVLAEEPRTSQDSAVDEYIHPMVPVRYPSAEQLQELEQRLHALRRDKAIALPMYVGHDIASGFPIYVVNAVVSQVQYISSEEDLEELCLIWNYAREIMDIITDVCD